MSKETIPTPDYSHLSSRDFEFVYEPAEDSFLLLDAIESEIETIHKLNPTICVEIGPGSGIISAGIGSVLKSASYVIACDINPKVF
jgi:release factor glutamine methyltransferase